MVPAVFRSFYCNQTPYKTDTSLRQTTDTSKSLTSTWEVFLSRLISKNTCKLCIEQSKVSQRTKDTCIPSLLTTNNDALTNYFSAYVYGH